MFLFFTTRNIYIRRLRCTEVTVQSEKTLFSVLLYHTQVKISNSQVLVLTIIINKSVCEFDYALFKQVGTNGQEPLHLLVE